MTIQKIKEQIREHLVEAICVASFFEYKQDNPDVDSCGVQIKLEDIDVDEEERTFICKKATVIFHIKNSTETPTVEKSESGNFECIGEEIIDIKVIPKL